MFFIQCGKWKTFFLKACCYIEIFSTAILLFSLKQVFWEKSLQKQSPEVFCKKVYLKISQSSQENTCARVCYILQVFSCEFCEIFKNTFFCRTPLVAASILILHYLHNNNTMLIPKFQNIAIVYYTYTWKTLITNLFYDNVFYTLLLFHCSTLLFINEFFLEKSKWKHVFIQYTFY